MASSVQPFAVARVRVWADIELIDGSVVHIGNENTGGDIVAVSATFALNTIPTASLVMATGRNPVTGKYASIHTLKDKLTARDKVTIYTKIDTGENDPFTTIVKDRINEKIQPGVYKIFEGYFVGIGYQRSQNHANYVLNLVHWLDDLNNSSAINGDWLPGAPTDLARAALVAAAGDGTSLNGTASVQTAVASFENAKSDLWLQTVSPICKSLASFSAITTQAGVTAPPDIKNDAALSALERMPGAVGTGGRKFYVPLGVKFGAEVENSNFSDALRQYFARTFGDSSEQNSFWAKIVSQVGAEFLFAISPAVDWALPIPFCGGLRASDAEMASITASEYTYSDFTTNMSQMLETVIIAYPIKSGTGVSTEKTTTPLPADAVTRIDNYKPFAMWPTREDIARMSAAMRRRGLKLFKSPPGWITGMDAATLTALSASLSDSPYPSAEAYTILPPAVRSVSAAYEGSKNLIAEFAHHWYLTDVLQQRVGELSGILRFDIAPGSLVKIDTPTRDRAVTSAAELATSALGTDNDYVTATVMSVSYVINAERATAGTSFTFSNVRTPKERESGLFAVDKPPLYQNAFVKAPLAERR